MNHPVSFRLRLQWLPPKWTKRTRARLVWAKRAEAVSASQSRPCPPANPRNLRRGPPTARRPRVPVGAGRAARLAPHGRDGAAILGRRVLLAARAGAEQPHELLALEAQQQPGQRVRDEPNAEVPGTGSGSDSDHSPGPNRVGAAVQGSGGVGLLLLTRDWDRTTPTKSRPTPAELAASGRAGRAPPSQNRLRAQSGVVNNRTGTVRASTTKGSGATV